MTVIAYTNGVMYSDRLSFKQDDNIIVKPHNYSKMFVNEDKTIAFCNTGTSIPAAVLDNIFFCIYKLIELDMYLNNVLIDQNFINDGDVKLVLGLSARGYIVMCEQQAYHITSSGMLKLDSNDLAVDGYDGNFFKALCLVGMDANEIIPHIHNNLSDQVSVNFDTFKQSDLIPLKKE